MSSPSERSPSRTAPRALSRRRFLIFAGGTGSLMLLTACGGGQPPQAPQAAPQPTQAPLAQPTGRTIATPEAARAAATVAPAAKPAAAQGRVVYAWHTTITPSWLDPQENPPQVTPYNFAYALHDALVKHLPGQTYAPSLAESYEIAPDYKSATFKLRPGIKFHDGTPVTPDDVKFTYESYRGANAAVLHQKLERIESPDDRTVKFIFKEPFLDFLVLYGSPASGAGWIVPKSYYQKVGKDGFKNNPVGAGPYKFVKQTAGQEIEFEAFTDYWRKSPSVKTLIMRGIPEGATRVALLQTGEVDFINMVPGDLLDTVKKDSRFELAPTRAGTIWIDFADGLANPNSPFFDIRIRQAVSLAIDRQAINDAEMGGLASDEGNWIPDDWPGSLQRKRPPTDLGKARQLMEDAGKGAGFDVEQLTPLPPYFSLAERVVSQLRQINIRTKVNTMERGAFYDALSNGPNRLKGLICAFSGAPGDAASRIREGITCDGTFSGTCLPEIDDRMKRYDASSDPKEREKLLNEVQTYILDNYVLVPVLRQSFINAKGPRIANKANEIIGAIPQYTYPGPYEEILLNG